ncbi:hypothetical protein SAMN05421823_10558 [Catalinimonas alkaloidigena]|uniref:DUF7847 domain-containing protein n=1 Tax=Catalinimonas alkaloidigena TaxID=1075417 RepID=A0A1G9INQ4_9BACT|nr:hypothetical protein [Catalinimonas alkaloidigena]SDL26782.1 hypothetical protein SAMN05421823_10558 [Catalinimonas alkaloidigena]
MITQERIEFRRVRDFGDKVGATFGFIRQEIRSLGKALLFIVGPFALATGILIGLIQQFIFSSVLIPATSSDPLTTVANPMVSGTYLLSQLLLMLLFVAGFIVSTGVLNVYVSRYVRGATSFEVSEIWQETWPRLGRLLLTGILYYFAVVLATLFFFFPGIWLAVSFSFAYLVVVHENAGPAKALSRSYELIKGKWWSTFGLMVVLYLLIVVFIWAITIPLSLIAGMFMEHSVATETAAPAWLGVMMVVGSTLGMLAAYLFSAVLGLGLAFQYFSQIERKEAVGLMERIQSVGTSKPSDETETY